MDDHKELNELVLAKLNDYKRDYPQAKELYDDVRHEDPKLVKNGYRSFVKLLNSFDNIEKIKKVEGSPSIYKKAK